MFLKILRKFFLWLICMIALILASGSACLYIFQDDIKQLAIEKINSKIYTKITVDEIDLSFLKHFPYASINFPNILVKESFPGSKNNLIEAQEISLAFNIWDILDKHYVIQKVFVKNGKINLLINSKNQTNFQIFKPDSSTRNSFNLDLEVIELKNVEIVYQDKFNPQYYSVFTEKSILNGKFNDSIFDLKIKTIFYVDEINYNHFSYLKSKNCSADFNLLIDQHQNKYSFQNAKAQIEKLEFKIDGFVQNRTIGVFNNLKIKSEALNLNRLIDLIPPIYAEKLKDFNLTGIGDINLKINGLYSDYSFPSLQSTGKIKLSELESKLEKFKGQKFKNLSFDYFYSNGSKQNDTSSFINLKNIETNYDNEILKGQFSLNNFLNPYINLSLKGNIGLSQLTPFINQPKIKSLSGKMRLDIYLKGLISDFKEVNNLNKINAFGKISLKEGAIELNENTLNFNNINGDFQFDKIDLVFNDFSANVSHSDFLMKGKIINIFPYLLNDNQNIEIDANIKSNNVDLDELLQATGSNGSNDSLYKFKINPKFIFKLSADCKKINFQKFLAQNLKGDFTIDKQILRSDYFSLKTMNGSVLGKLSIDASLTKELLINADVNLEKINIRKMFYSFGNFGQDFLKEDNINGSLSSNINLSSIWTNTLQFIPDKFYAKSKLLIENGELINFEPLQALAKYISLEDLKNLKFQSLQNEIEIKDQVINIPSMEVNNNALNLSLYGIHSFENTFDYHLKIKLNELLNKKRKNKKEEEFGPLEEDAKGATTLFLRMYGTSENTLFSVDKAAMKQKISSDISNEGKEIKNILKEEFNSIFKKGVSNPVKEEAPVNSWESDIPKSGNQLKSKEPDKVQSNNPTKKEEKSRLQKLKDKLKEKDEEDL